MLRIFSYVYYPCEFLFSSLHIHFHCPFFWLVVFFFYIFWELLYFRNVNPWICVCKYIFTILLSVCDVFCHMKIVNYYAIKYVFFFIASEIICFVQGGLSISRSYKHSPIFSPQFLKPSNLTAIFKLYTWYDVGFCLY